MDPREPIPGDPVDVTDLGPVDVTDVALGAAVITADATYRTARSCVRLGASVARSGYRTARAAARWVPPPVAAPVARRVDTLARRAEAQGELVRVVAPAVLAALVQRVLDRTVPWVVANALDRIDLTALVSQRVDLDAVVATVDLDAAVERVDIEAIVGRLDLDAIVASVDLDGAVARVDVDTIVRKVDMAVITEIARKVVDAIDLPLIIRESSGGVAADLVTDVRLQTIDADQSFARFLDRVLRRNAPPQVGPGGTGAAT